MVAGGTAPAVRPVTWRTWIEPWFLSYALLGASVAGMAPILLPLSVRMGGSATDIGLVMGAFNLGGLSAPAWGRIADHHGLHRVLLLTGLLGTAFSLAVFPSVSSLSVRLLLALAQGAGAASAATVANLFIVEIRPRSEWDERIGWLQTFYGGGQVLGLLLAGLLSGSDLHFGFIIAAGITLSACLPVFFIKRIRRSVPVPRPVLNHPSRHAGLTALSPQSLYHHVNFEALVSQVRSLVLPFGIFLFGWFMSYGGVAAFFSLFPVLMKQVYGVDPSTGSIAFAAAATAGLFLYAPAGTLSRKYGALAVFRWALVIRVLAFLALLTIGFANNGAGGVLAIISFGFVVMAWSILSVTGTQITAQFSEEHEGEGLGLFNASTGLAGFLGAVIGGWSAGMWGYKVVPALGVGGVAVGMLMSGKVKPPASKPEEKEKG